MMKMRLKAWAAATALIAAACSLVWTPYDPTPAVVSRKPLVIMVCGWNETPGNSWLVPLAADLRAKGYDVQMYGYNNGSIPWPADRPVWAIGFSYGGDTLCSYSRQGHRIDRLTLLNPVRQGNVFKQGMPLYFGRANKVEVYASSDTFPAASDTIIDSMGNEFHAVLIPGTTHTSLVGAAEKIIINSI